MDFLKVYGIEDLNSFPSGTWGIKEPGLQWQGTTRLNGLCSVFKCFGEYSGRHLNGLAALDRGCETLDMILLPGLLFIGLEFSIFQSASRSTFFAGVAFDHSLSRLGHGKGYYDRFITSYVASGRSRPLLGLSSVTSMRNNLHRKQWHLLSVNKSWKVTQSR